MFSSIIRSQEDNIVSDTKEITETNLAENTIRLILIIIYKNYNIFHYKTETMSKLTTTSMNCQREGLH